MALAELIDVGKCYTKYEDVPTLVSGARHMLRRGKRGKLWAARHVDLSVERGEAIGVIGRNGSGKSTTLGMLAGVTAPSEGIVRVNGRLAPLLRLGVGFEQELTGRENVFINGMILGMTTKEVEQRFDSIVAFAEMEQFIDTPVKFYSSGMLVRLGFASAVAAEPDLLIVDEVLAVGDLSFQFRSFERMMEMRDNGATLVVVSHNMAAIRRLVERTMVLHKGEVKYLGPTTEAISIYHDLMRDAMREQRGETDAAPTVDVLSFEMFGEGGLPTSNVRSGETVTFRMQVRFDETIHDAMFGINIASEAGQFVYGENSVETVKQTFNAGEVYTFKMNAPLGLTSGSYTASGGVHWGAAVKGQVNSTAKIFYVTGRPLTRGLVDLNATFEVESPPEL
jgi:ABC-type polysaccharide/polyol phosphate transport system ATPase subunit